MSLLPLSITPGLYLNRTPYSSKGRWVDGNCVRFRDGVPQQIGGWRQASGSGGITGVPRCAISWRPGNQHGRYCAIGTNEGVFVYDGGHISNITPVGYVPGRVDSQPGAGYGGGLYGHGLYGEPTIGSGVVLDAASWSMDMWGEYVVAVGYDGVVCQYTGTGVLAPIAGAPSARSLVVTDERILMLLGANGIPNRIQWSDQEDNSNYTPDATNKAGGFTLNTVTQLQCGVRGRGVTFVWSDTDLFGFSPTYNQFVYSYERLGQNCGAASQNAACIVGEVPYWMGVDGFYCYDGQVQRLDCDINDYVFGDPSNGVAADLNIDQRNKVHVRVNTLFEEIWFSYPSAGSTECDRLAIFNYRNGTWSKAHLARTAWCDRGAFALPMALDPNAALFEHEVGHFANGGQIDSYVECSPIELGNGDVVQQIRSFWPEMRQGNGTINLLLKMRQTPRGPEFVRGPFPFTADTQRVLLSAVARQMAVRIEATAPGDYWELGQPRVEITAGGGR
jgi:hypothetical protein